MNSREDLKAIPSVDEAIRYLESADLLGDRPRPLVVRAVRAALEDERQEMLAGRRELSQGTDDARQRILKRLERVLAQLDQRRLQPVVNATGIVVHTNLGRAPLSEEALAAISEVSRGYTNLEYDLSAAKRGKRHIVVRDAICELCDVEDALVVNNNAAAVLLALNTLAAGREVVVSRSELIEIGGSFRLPEVFEKSGSKMVEVGTTNRTHLVDFERAIRGRTGAIMSAHWSNYEIVGFVERVGLSELAALGERYGIPVLHDLGSGLLTDAGALGLPGEMTVRDSVRAGASVSTFSGDKLLGGPQAGIAVGRGDVISRMRANPLMRALRPGKLTLVALSVTLGHYLKDEAHAKVPVLAMITGSVDELAGRARAMVEELNGRLAGRATARAVDLSARVGGGAAPEREIPSRGLEIELRGVSASAVVVRMHESSPPVVARTREDRIVVDLRTVFPHQDALVVAALVEAIEER
jgi:L-seryl-tRNA(Ser) seleniumtransferase